MTPLANQDLAALVLTFQLALITTLILIVMGTPLAWWLAQTRSRLRLLVEPIVALPIILPPTVVGFYLLIAFAPDAWFGGGWFALTGSQLAFSFNALVIGSVIYSLPFYVQPLQISFENLDQGIIDAAATLGATPLDRFFSLVLPLCRRGFVTATTLGFAHTIGEFGIVLMIGGNIPGETRVLSIALYDHVESLNYTQAHWMAGGLLVFSFVLLLLVYGTNQKIRFRLEK
jgi:molybdate transport system permease protein